MKGSILISRDPLMLPGTNISTEDCLKISKALPGTEGQHYVERRGISVEVAVEAGVRYVDDFGGRSAVVVGLYDNQDHLASLHGRYLESTRQQNKMLTIGRGDGVINLLGGWRAEPLIIVEGLFDALSLAACGFACVATIGRRVTWIPDITAGRQVWLAFDRSRSGDAEALSYSARMSQSRVRRMLPPGQSKDWNTALVKRGQTAVIRAVRMSLSGSR